MVVGLKTETRLLELQPFQIVLLNLVIRRRLQLQHQRLTNMARDMRMLTQMAPLIVKLVIISMKVQVLVCNVLLGTIVLVVLHQIVAPRQHHVLLEHIIAMKVASMRMLVFLLTRMMMVVDIMGQWRESTV